MTDEPEIVPIAAGGLSAGIAPLGAELRYLRDAAGRDLLWHGDPAVWAGRAPLLFPIVGALRDDRYRLNGRVYPLARHGFARRSRFAVVARAADAVTFRLEADETSRTVYPFDFRLDLRFATTGATIEMAATLTNREAAPMPASFGFHPALRWPLPYGQPRDRHRIVFAEPESAPIRRLDPAGLLDPHLRPSPVTGRDLPLDDALFLEDAIIFDRLASRRLRYGARQGPQLTIDFADMPMLGVWTKPGAGYVCIEPWQGIADPAGFAGDLFAKPGIVVLTPGESRRFAMSISLDEGE